MVYCLVMSFSIQTTSPISQLLPHLLTPFMALHLPIFLNVAITTRVVTIVDVVVDDLLVQVMMIKIALIIQIIAAQMILTCVNSLCIPSMITLRKLGHDSRYVMASIIQQQLVAIAIIMLLILLL